jgi:hypothetical protein
VRDVLLLFLVQHVQFENGRRMKHVVSRLPEDKSHFVVIGRQLWWSRRLLGNSGERVNIFDCFERFLEDLSFVRSSVDTTVSRVQFERVYLPEFHIDRLVELNETCLQVKCLRFGQLKINAVHLL